jgi:hypothetical protein
MNKGLEHYYAGDETWEAFVALAMPDWGDTGLQRTLLERMGGHLDLAAVIYARFGSGSLAWIDTRVPALHGLTPVACVGTQKRVRRLREALLRMDFGGPV